MRKGSHHPPPPPRPLTTKRILRKVNAFELAPPPPEPEDLTMPKKRVKLTFGSPQQRTINACNERLAAVAADLDAVRREIEALELAVSVTPESDALVLRLARAHQRRMKLEKVRDMVQDLRATTESSYVQAVVRVRARKLDGAGREWDEGPDA